jgi:hypothetical protein
MAAGVLIHAELFAPFASRGPAAGYGPWATSWPVQGPKRKARGRSLNNVTGPPEILTFGAFP